MLFRQVSDESTCRQVSVCVTYFGGCRALFEHRGARPVLDLMIRWGSGARVIQRISSAGPTAARRFTRLGHVVDGSRSTHPARFLRRPRPAPAAGAAQQLQATMAASYDL